MNPMTVRRLAFSLLLLSAAACSTSGSAAARPRKNRAVLTAEELRASPHPTLLALIQAERPHWLRTTQTTITNRPDTVMVYQDNFRLGGVALLAMFRPATVYSVQYYSASDANGRFGAGHDGGVINVRTTPPR